MIVQDLLNLFQIGFALDLRRAQHRQKDAARSGGQESARGEQEALAQVLDVLLAVSNQIVAIKGADDTSPPLPLIYPTPCRVRLPSSRRPARTRVCRRRVRPDAHTSPASARSCRLRGLRTWRRPGAPSRPLSTPIARQRCRSQRGDGPAVSVLRRRGLQRLLKRSARRRRASPPRSVHELRPLRRPRPIPARGETGACSRRAISPPTIRPLPLLR